MEHAGRVDHFDRVWRRRQHLGVQRRAEKVIGMCNDRYPPKPFDLENSLVSGQSSRDRV